MATGFPFGAYDYSGDLGPEAGRRTAGDPAGLDLDGVAGLARRRSGSPGPAPARIALAARRASPPGTCSSTRRWSPRATGPGSIPTPALPGVPGVPVGNYLGWLVVARGDDGRCSPLVAGPTAGSRPATTPRCTRSTSGRTPPRVLAHAVFLDLPASAGWGALGDGRGRDPAGGRRSCGATSGCRHDRWALAALVAAVGALTAHTVVNARAAAPPRRPAIHSGRSRSPSCCRCATRPPGSARA